MDMFIYGMAFGCVVCMAIETYQRISLINRKHREQVEQIYKNAAEINRQIDRMMRKPIKPTLYLVRS